MGLECLICKSIIYIYKNKEETNKNILEFSINCIGE